MERQNPVEDPKYYKTKPDNLFDKHSTYGLNLEGIKKYCSCPDNFRYEHQEFIKESIRKKIENFMKMKKSKKINKVQEKYDHLNENINILYERIKRYNSITRKKFPNKRFNFNKYRSSTEINIGRSNTIKENKKQTAPIKIGKFKKLNSSIEKKLLEKKLPQICPRPIIIDYCLTYSTIDRNQSTKYTNGYKNLGFNSYFMGTKYNPHNYDVAQKNRISRNVFGTLFCH